MCFVVNKFLHLFQVLRNFQNTATAINAPPSPLHALIGDLRNELACFTKILKAIFQNPKKLYGKQLLKSLIK